MRFNKYLQIRIVASEPEKTLSKLLSANIELWDIYFQDQLTVILTINNQDMTVVTNVIQNSGASCKIFQHVGVLWMLESIMKRWVLICGILLFFISVLWIPNRLFSENLILSALESRGIFFGTKASEIRNEEIKNYLLSTIPQLQWVGLEIDGCCAVVNVRERNKQEEILSGKLQGANIVAAKDAVITKVTVERGSQLCQVGDSVQEGNVIVSGYTDCGIKVIAEKAEAEIFGHTIEEKTFVLPIFTGRSSSSVNKLHCYKLRIGKKVINLCNHSGISDATCVKMYLEKYWTLPGGFRLPVSIIQIRYFQPEVISVNQENAYTWLEEFARSYMRQQMIAGEILSEATYFETYEDRYVLTGVYSCNELIGQVKYEEIIGQNAEDN